MPDAKRENHVWRCMRLSESTCAVIRSTVQDIFGSRINDNSRGGDIDLLIELPSTTTEPERKALQLITRLQMRIGDQPIDVLVLNPSTPRQAIHEHAILTGMTL
jgi:predicted nucleotidyltransferase